ncbi:MAG TPA: PHP domain-containing protein [Candidatus Mediterraneibacter faecavium]|uniref:PHP domain-containing protein n=1 Tax=Candidatus Mediterraneibacter faecavium TaxID=2838668 RepID=A0A9D2TMW8_9FIRM|nr:PHP domain-containing protein [Candidatus Mediterraneibacter faecavium]
MIPLYYDLHIHSCLSPCGDDDMTPANIVGMAAVKGLDVIALTDHNSCRNCPAAMYHGEKYGVTVIPGMELTTQEEVHVICLFPTLDDALRFDALIYEKLLPFPNREDIFGKQQIMDERDEVTGTVKNLLINATSISFDDVFPLVGSFQGIAYPAHVDKASTSLLSNLGFVPPGSTFTCAEFHDFKNLHRIRREHPYFENCNVICCSDAHYLQDIHEPEYQLYAKSREISDILETLTKGLPIHTDL